MSNEVHVDVLIFGAGLAGLWTASHLRDKGYSTLLIEKNKIGHGQTIGSQGTVYGGVKYAVGAAFREDSVAEIKGMPNRWWDHLNGKMAPDLSNVKVVSDFIYLWVPKGRIFQSLFSQRGVDILESKPIKMNLDECPDFLRESAQTVYKVSDPVLETNSLLAELGRPVADRLLYSNQGNMKVEFGNSGVKSIFLDDKNLIIFPRNVVLTAGIGNGELAKKMGISRTVMQERPLRQVYVRGNLPEFNGHCIDVIGITKNVFGTSKSFPTVATISTHPDPKTGKTVWNVGGRIAEEGVEKNPEQLSQDARIELSRILKGIDFSDKEMGSFYTVRAEIDTGTGERPGGTAIYNEGNVFVCWPTKLSLAPALADKIEKRIPKSIISEKEIPVDLLEGVLVANYPWEE